MIWLFKVDEVFWNDTPKVNEYYTFDTNDVEFDITQYDISLYFGTANYYLLNDSTNEEVYNLRFVGVNSNPMMSLVSNDSEIYSIVREFYIYKSKQK